MRRILVLSVVVLLVAATGALWVLSPPSTRITAYFSAAVGVHEGTDVRVLGVKVGKVLSVHPEPQQVKVILVVDHDVELPADAHGVVVTPTVVSDRYVQLTPAYTGGPRIAHGAVIPVERTATPVELDQLYASLDRMTTDLGPGGANKDGALSELLDTGAANLKGNGAAMNEMISKLGQAAKTLNDSQKDLFGTVSHLQKFTSMLARNDSQVRAAERQLAEVTGFLAADKEDLGAALAELPGALAKVQGFIKDNRVRIKSSVDKLAEITKVLVAQKASLAEALDSAPLAVTNLMNAYDPARKVLDGRVNINELSPLFPLPPVGETR
ncbi:MCE family protein [Allokutzneria sp. A3M-2-11 16]|uniref:MCE family protein n=1 Tax=Allokutzneria sp. A3M-2-11 16 TaxID=2962043 RepID=UPI0020B7E0A4|nr:MCE family protein [Allokutzneria sp. A3M-2-11 16]MCP3803864.1 MCE family protein [Allokutzneria sp. A3M-2-11 16]